MTQNTEPKTAASELKRSPQASLLDRRYSLATVGLTGILGVAIGAVVMLASGGPNRLTDDTKIRIEAAFPNSTFDRIRYDETSGLVTAESGATIIYFTTDGKIALVGNLLDLENKIDLTAKRQEELQAASVLEARAFGKVAPAQAAAPSAPSAGVAPQRPTAPQSVDIASIPDTNLVVHNPGASKVVYVVSDYNCSFCRRLHSEMEGLDIEIREIPVGFLGQDSTIKGSAALCSDDPEALAKGFFNGSAGTRISTCTEGDAAVQANTAWASQMGITGTPFIIVPGDETTPMRTNSGYMELHRLLPFIGLNS